LRDLETPSAQEVVVYKQPAVGISAKLAAARNTSNEIARNPWVARRGGMQLRISSQEAEELKQAGARELPRGRQVVASWIWMVLNPQLDHCEYELELLGRTLTFRHHDRAFERLQPLRNALIGAGRATYDDMLGEIEAYDSAVRSHDEALANLVAAARAVYDELARQQAFASVVATCSIREGPRESPVSTEQLVIWQRTLAAHVVNDPPNLDETYGAVAAMWNACSAELKDAVPPSLAKALRESRTQFADAVATTSRVLVSLRKEWSRTLDIPVAPGAMIEAPAD